MQFSVQTLLAALLAATSVAAATNSGYCELDTYTGNRYFCVIDGVVS